MARTKKKESKKTPPKKGKDYAKLKRAAYEYIVIQGKSLDETAELLSVSKVSLSNWGNESEPTWIDQRKARQQCFTTDSANTRNIIRLLSERRLELETEIIKARRSGDKAEELNLREEARGISDEISKHNKTLLNLDKENRVTLGVYIDVMEGIFNDLRTFNEDLFLKTVDFQSQHIRKKMIELG